VDVWEAGVNVDEYNAQIAAGMSEAKLQDLVVKLAQALGWKHIMHIHDSRRGLGQGFPDLCMVRGERVVFAELKTMRGRMSPAQKSWRDALWDSVGEWYCWRPDDLLRGSVEQCLR
jgi:hypothetical protein